MLNPSTDAVTWVGINKRPLQIFKVGLEGKIKCLSHAVVPTVLIIFR